MNAGKRAWIGVSVAVVALASSRVSAREVVDDPDVPASDEQPSPLDEVAAGAEPATDLDEGVLEDPLAGTVEPFAAETAPMEAIEVRPKSPAPMDRPPLRDEVVAVRSETTALPPTPHADVPPRGPVHRRRRIAGASLVTLGLAAGGTGLGLAATSLALNIPTGCGGGDPLTPCATGVAVRGTRLGAGVATGVGAAVLIGIGVGTLVRTPKGDALEVGRDKRIATRVTGAVGLAAGVGMVAGAAAIAVHASQAYLAKGALDGSGMRGAVGRANAVLGLGVGGLVVIGASAGLISARRKARGRLAALGGPSVGSGYVGWSISGRVPW